MKKIISFCLYGHLPLYCLGMIENIDCIKKYYEGWIIRVYHNKVPETILDALKKDCELIQCEHNGYNWEGMFWRFNVFDDDDVDVWISRDCDSRVTEREAKMVKDWINSEKTVHIIRDHKFHKCRILGGMFGVKNQIFRKKYKIKTIREYKESFYKIYPKGMDRQPDQIFLGKVIWPLIREDNMAHVGNKRCLFLPSDLVVKPDANFVGKVIQPSQETIHRYGKLLTPSEVTSI
jgi:hypothetical protein